MSTVQTITPNVLTALSAVAYTSGTVHTVSGITRDEDFAIVLIADAASPAATVTVYAGDYCNSSSDYTASQAASGSITAIYGFDGAAYRQDDGTYRISSTGSGNYYIVQK